MLRALLPVAIMASLGWAGCMGPIPPSERVNDAARDLNVNSRFGDVGGLAHFAAPAFREQFLSRRAEWGRALRVVDVELAGIQLTDADHANVSVDFSWSREDEGTLRTTRVLQEWEDEGGGWKLVREKRASGDIGLFGEKVAAKSTPEPRPDYHFATKVIR